MSKAMCVGSSYMYTLSLVTELCALWGAYALLRLQSLPQKPG